MINGRGAGGWEDVRGRLYCQSPTWATPGHPRALVEKKGHRRASQRCREEPSLYMSSPYRILMEKTKAAFTFSVGFQEPRETFSVGALLGGKVIKR